MWLTGWDRIEKRGHIQICGVSDPSGTHGRDVCYLITKLVPREKSPDLHRSQSQMKFTNRREKKGQKTKVLRKSKRNDILKSRMERISRKWSIISNVGERWETKEYLSVDSDRKVFKILTKVNGWRVNMSYNSTDSKDICLSFTMKERSTII